MLANCLTLVLLTTYLCTCITYFSANHKACLEVSYLASIFFCFIPMKISQSLLVSKGWVKILIKPNVTTLFDPCQTFCFDGECTSPSTHFVTLYLLLLLHAAEWKFPFYLPDGAEIFAHRVIYTDFRMITNSRYLNANYETSSQNSFKKGNLPWVDGFLCWLSDWNGS